MDNTEELSDYYECVLTPNNAPADCKTGVTFKGKDADYLKAHKMIMNIAQNKGDRYMINDTEGNISDAPKNKPACVEIKSKLGQTGKANLKIYAKNGRGFGTIHITKISKGEFEHVKILAFKVIKYLLDKVISGEVQNEDIEKMKNKSGSKKGKKAYYHCCKSCGSKFETDQDLTVHMKTDHTEKKVMCMMCENTFKTLEELEEHEQQDHTQKFKCSLCDSSFRKQEEVDDHKQINHVGNSYKCKLCDNKFNDEKDLEKHIQNNHAGMCSPTSKRIKTNLEKGDEEEEKMEVDDPYMIRSKMNDEKVIAMQKRYDKEHDQINELKRKKSIQKEEENNKKKKLSLKKKKSKRKNKKESSEEKPLKLRLKEIPEKYNEIFKESGKERKEFGIFSVKPDGACGANSTAIHCHRDQNLGPYVMRNVNEYTVKFWPFFQEYFQFPIEVKVGSRTMKYDNEQEFLDFLKSDQKSGYMWMEHQGWQVVANMYNIKINILTLLPTGVRGVPAARWTYIIPDERLRRFSTIHSGLPDMWIMHNDETHYDLLVHKDSELAKEGSVEELEKTSNNKVVNEEENEEHDFSLSGPGYMGWEINDEIEKKSDDTDTKKTVVELMECYAVIKKEVENMKKESIKKEKKQDAEIKMLKEEFKRCLQDLKNETYARTKAESLAKVLQETLDARDELEKVDKTEEMDIDAKVDEVDEGGKWEKQRSEKRRMKRNRDSVLVCKDCGKTFSSKTSLYEHCLDHRVHVCDECSKCFQSKKELEVHRRHHKQEQVSYNQPQDHVMFTCKKCIENFDNEDELKTHMISHEEKRLDCKECGEIFIYENLVRDQVKNHAQSGSDKCYKCEQKASSKDEHETHLGLHSRQSSNTKYQCSKCENEYYDMRKLRRHDWRAHRQIECSICTEMLKSRQELKEHRKQEHQMLKKVACKFYPDCYDGDECLFDHINLDAEISVNFCLNGQNCSNQECLFSEKQHRIYNQITCKFQALCNRAGCQFKHNVQRKAFLGLNVPPKRKV